MEIKTRRICTNPRCFVHEGEICAVGHMQAHGTECAFMASGENIARACEKKEAQDRKEYLARREAYAVQMAASLSLMSASLSQRWPSTENFQHMAGKAVEVVEAVMQANKVAP